MDSPILHSLPKSEGAYIVGGTVRDLLVNRRPVDYDLAVTGSPEDFAGALLQSTPGRQVVIGKGGQTVVRVVTAEAVYDICAVSGGRIEEDLARRDFTINAMAICLSSGRLIDPLGGRADIAAGLVRRVSPSAFANDPLRLLRAYRLAAQLGFGIESHTASAIAKEAFLIRCTAAERLRDELFKLLSNNKAAGYLRQMAHSGLLLHLFPELKPLVGCLQPPPHRWDVFDHTLETVSRLEMLLAAPPAALAAYRGSIGALNNQITAARLKCAALFHDIGKPHCSSLDDCNQVHFHGHAAHSAGLVLQISRRLRFSNPETDYIRTIVGHHQRLLFLYADWRRNRLSARAVARLFMACQDLTPDLILHAMADMRAKTATPRSAMSFERFGCELVGRFLESFQPIRSQPPLMTGHDLVERFGLQPSPLFKEILDELEIARHTGAVTNREEAEAAVGEMLRVRSEISLQG